MSNNARNAGTCQPEEVAKQLVTELPSDISREAVAELVGIADRMGRARGVGLQMLQRLFMARFRDLGGRLRDSAGAAPDLVRLGGTPDAESTPASRSEERSGSKAAMRKRLEELIR